MRLRRIAYCFIALAGLAVNLVSLIVAGAFTPSGILHYISEFSPFVLAVRLTIVILFALVGYLLLRYDHLLTTRKQAEERLRESEERFRSLTNDVLDSSAVGIFILDADFKVAWINRALERYFGLSRQHIIGKDKRTLIRENIKGIFEDGEGFAEKVFSTYDNNTYIENFECHVLASQGREERWLEHWSQPIRSGLYAGGRIEHYTDITARKRMEEALAESEEKYRTLAEAATEGITIIGVPDGEIKYANPACTQSVGYEDSEEMLGRNPLDFIAPEDREQVGKGLRELARGGLEKFEQTVRTLTKDGQTKSHELRAVRIQYQGEPAVLVTGRDVTEIRRLWEELNRQLLHDSLTGVYNRRCFNETIIQEIKRADRYEHHTSFIMGDVDGLKEVNDNFGHLVGDQILQGLAQVLESSVRAADMVIRYGGDEFLVVMPETPEDQARAAASRIEQNLANWLTEQVKIGALHHNIPEQVGFSMGVASYQPGEERAVEEVIARADEAMYRAKQVKGRTLACA